MVFYETAADLEREEEVADSLEQSWRCEMLKWEGKQILDYIAKKEGEIVALVEIRTRKVERQKYGSVFLSGLKIQKALELTKLMKVPFLFAVKWTDTLGWIDVSKKLDRVRWSYGGRRKMRDKDDHEILAEFPTNEFRLI